jgi:hypothetical protein
LGRGIRFRAKRRQRSQSREVRVRERSSIFFASRNLIHRSAARMATKSDSFVKLWVAMASRRVRSCSFTLARTVRVRDISRFALILEMNGFRRLERRDEKVAKKLRMS